MLNNYFLLDCSLLKAFHLTLHHLLKFIKWNTYNQATTENEEIIGNLSGEQTNMNIENKYKDMFNKLLNFLRDRLNVYP